MAQDQQRVEGDSGGGMNPMTEWLLGCMIAAYKWGRDYSIVLAEAFSEFFNAIHKSGDSHQTFSARLAIKRDSGDLGFPAFYWYAWILFFERVFPGHLDWAKGPDE